MNLYKIARLIFSAAIICGACACQKESLKDTDDNVNNKPVGQVELSFDFLKGSVEMDSRATNQPEEEEGKVNSLLYAVFMGNEKQKIDYLDFKNNPKRTGQSYSILKLSSDWFNTTTEVFALANVDEALKTELLKQNDVKQWRELTYTAGLNDVAGKNDSRVVDNPVMAGYLNLKDGVTDKISVKMERVHCRISLFFVWQNHPLAECVTIDEIKISRLHKRSRYFNIFNYVWEDKLDKEEPEEITIKNLDDTQKPFIGRLTKAPYHYGDTPKLDFIEKQEKDFNILCRYTWKGDQMITNQPPVKYYVYSQQKGGTSLNDDPIIEIKYHYQYKDFGTLYKKATAHMYDKTADTGKKHHGLLRNYNYQLNCVVNTITNQMDIQVVSVPWYEIKINDIPSFQ